MEMMKRLLALLCGIVITVSYCALPVSGAVVISTDSEMLIQKVSAELRDMLTSTAEGDRIPVYIFRKMITDEKIDQLMISEMNMNPDTYTGEKLFSGYMIPKLEQMKISVNNRIRLIDVQNAMTSGVSDYISSRRSILSREYAIDNQSFINRFGILPGNVIYSGKYTSTVIVLATPSEILEYASSDNVENISLFEDFEQVPELDIIQTQIGTDRESGTKSNRYNSRMGYTGAGIVIGVIEAESGIYDSDSPHLRDIPESQLSYVYNYRSDGTVLEPVISDHATKVVSLLIGKGLDAWGSVYEGVAPDAKVYQTSAERCADVFTAFNILADLGVHIINYSAGSRASGYSAYDREIDRLIESTKVTFVKSAGNTGGEITSPGKALNAITVGNLETKSEYRTAIEAPYSLHATSAYFEADYLPNKPDLVAPGTMISTMANDDTVTSGTGTSFAAPIVVGVIAQMMQRVPLLVGNPYRVKSLIISFSDNVRLSDEDDDFMDENGYLRDRSGAGLIDAKQLLKGFTHGNKMLYNSGENYTYRNIKLSEGQRIRVVMVFFKSNEYYIDSIEDMDDLDLVLLDGDGNTLDIAASERNNVEIIEYTVPADGIYSIEVLAKRVIDPEVGVPYGISWRVISD